MLNWSQDVKPRPDVQMLASSYSKISETPNPFVALLTAQLRTDQAYAALGVLQDIVAVDDENFIQFILQYLKKAESIIVDDEKGVEILVLAANCLKSKVTSQEIFVNATTTVLRAFILRVCRATFSLSYKSLQTQACRRAIELLAKTRGGATDEELQLIADGFTCGVSCSIGAGRDASDGIGMLCRKLFINISKAPEVDCVPMLLRVLHDDCLCEAKLHAVQALAALAPRDVVVPKLLELLESELMLKIEALELLEQYKEDVEVQRCVSKLLSHPDPSVRLAALRVTAPAAGLPEALEDSYSAVVLYALSEMTAATTDVKALRPLLEHVDGKVRLHTTRLLGQASDKELAKEALQRGSTWPEIDSAVLEAREVALRSLEQ